MDIATAALTPVSEGSGRRQRLAGARSRPTGAASISSPTATASSSSCGASTSPPARSKYLTGHIPWDIDSFARSDDGRYLAWVANVDGLSRLTVVNVASRTESLPPLPDGRIGRIAFDRTGKTARAVARERAVAARRVRARARAQRARALHEERGRARSIRCSSCPPELVRYPTFDREHGKYRQIPAFVFRPRTPGPASGAHRHPRRARIAVHARLRIRSRSSWCASWASR